MTVDTSKIVTGGIKGYLTYSFEVDAEPEGKVVIPEDALISYLHKLGTISKSVKTTEIELAHRENPFVVRGKTVVLDPVEIVEVLTYDGYKLRQQQMKEHKNIVLLSFKEDDGKLMDGYYGFISKISRADEGEYSTITYTFTPLSDNVEADAPVAE